jgi:hypothetical protein
MAGRTSIKSKFRQAPGRFTPSHGVRSVGKLCGDTHPFHARSVGRATGRLGYRAGARAHGEVRRIGRIPDKCWREERHVVVGGFVLFEDTDGKGHNRDVRSKSGQSSGLVCRTVSKILDVQLH